MTTDLHWSQTKPFRWILRRRAKRIGVVSMDRFGRWWGSCDGHRGAITADTREQVQAMVEAEVRRQDAAGRA